MKSKRTYKGFEIVETDSGYGARPIGDDVTIGLAGTYQGHKTIKGLKEAITADAATTHVTEAEFGEMILADFESQPPLEVQS